MPFTRLHSRLENQLRDIKLQSDYIDNADGSVLICCGNTKVICTASIENRVPAFLRGKKQGWITAEYGMLPRSTHQRMNREVTRGKASGRTLEIQRLIGRSLRACVDLSQMADYTITIDCDVIQADGGTRTASITGAYVALKQATQRLLISQKIKKDPLICQIAAISVGIVADTALLDLNYQEDSQAQVDMNVVMDTNGRFIELQGTAEDTPFSKTQLNDMLSLAEEGIEQIFLHQNAVFTEVETK